jgi:hypothetical protein
MQSQIIAFPRLGLNGVIEADANALNINSAGTKTMNMFFGGTLVIGSSPTTVTTNPLYIKIRNAGLRALRIPNRPPILLRLPQT